MRAFCDRLRSFFHKLRGGGGRARMARQAGLVTGGNGIASIISLSNTALIAFALGPSNFGIWALVLGIVGVATALLGFRTADALTAHLGRYSRLQRLRPRLAVILSAALQIELGVAATTMIVLLALTSVLRAGFHLPVNAERLIFFVAMNGVFSAVGTIWQPVERAQGRIVMVAVAVVITPACSLLLNGTFWLMGKLTVDAVALNFMIAGLAYGTLSVLGIVRYFRREGFALRTLLRPFRPRLERSIRPFLHMSFFGFWSATLSAIIRQADVLLLGALSIHAEVGIYRFAKSFAAPLDLLAGSLNTVIFYDLSQALSARDGPKFRQIVRNSLWLTIPLDLIGALMIATVYLLHLETLLGAYQGSFDCFAILFIGRSVALIFFWIVPSALALRAVRTILVTSIINTVIFIAIAGVAVHAYGARGAAIALSGALILGNGLLFAAMRKRLP
jgi:O-antigen/teichoic acid export membrane protein